MRKKKSMYTLQLQCGISMFILLFEELVHVNDHNSTLLSAIIIRWNKLISTIHIDCTKIQNRLSNPEGFVNCCCLHFLHIFLHFFFFLNIHRDDLTTTDKC